MKTDTKRKLEAILFPERCPFCDDVIRPCEAACEECLENLPTTKYSKIIFGTYNCSSAVTYKEQYSDAIKALKFGDTPQFAYQLAKLMAERINREQDLPEFDVITYVPLHSETLKERGFNQCELIAKSLGEFLGIPCEELLKKTRKTEPQHNLTGDKRRKNVMGVFRPINRENVKGRNILLVDDIVTTGLTLAECAKTLDEAKAEKIFCTTFAITLPKTT